MEPDRWNAGQDDVVVIAHIEAREKVDRVAGGRVITTGGRIRRRQQQARSDHHRRKTATSHTLHSRTRPGPSPRE